MIVFDWEDDALIITRCTKMQTAPDECKTCNKRFRCYTERDGGDDIDMRVGLETQTKLSDLLKVIEELGAKSN